MKKRKRRRQRLRTGARRSILLGTDPFAGNEIRLPLDPREARQYGMHVIGSPGKGKSKFLEWLIRNDILNGDGLCLIDPHGSLYKQVVKWCAANKIFRKRKVILLDLDAHEWVFGFNPLGFGAIDDGSVANAIAGAVNAIAEKWGGEDFDKKPEIAGVLPMLLHTLWANKLTLPDGARLCRPGLFQDAAVAQVKDEAMREEWEYYRGLPRAEFVQRIWGARNRLREFSTNPDLRLMLGQTSCTLDLKGAMDEHAVVLVNLGKLSEPNKRTIGVLLQNDIFVKGIQRVPDDPTASPPFHVYLDEAYYFINQDTERIIDGLRKFGVHLTLAHHRLSQLRKAGESATQAVLQIPNKVVFGGIVAPDAEELVDYMFIDEIDYQESKERFDKPAVVGQQRTWFRSFADSAGSSVTEGACAGRN